MVTIEPLLSICIPSYSRPSQIFDLLTSVDCDAKSVEIVVSEDRSPKQEEIRARVRAFQSTSSYRVQYSENERNLGYDGNIRRLIALASGKFVMFMGDDDLFIPGALDRFLKFLGEHKDKKYILRSYIAIHSDGAVENYRYLKESESLPPGEETVAWLFKRSVSIAGFTISREDALSAATDQLDGTLLYQLYVMARVCLESESIYCDIPVAQVTQSFREGNPNFGASEAEKGRFTPGRITPDNSINFTRGYFEVSEYIDKECGTGLTKRVKTELSKYAYPFLSIQRRNGMKAFLEYAARLETEMGFGCTWYFHFYKWALVLLGEKSCDRLIVRIKKLLGATPNL